jgi:hypothetical protein
MIRCNRDAALQFRASRLFRFRVGTLHVKNGPAGVNLPAAFGESTGEADQIE